MGNFKDKIMDILFDSDTDPIVEDGPLKDPIPPKKDTKPIKEDKKPDQNKAPLEPVKGPSAKDILYGNKKTNEIFIDIFPSKDGQVASKSEDSKEEKYELRENVSPIFGIINQKEKKKKQSNIKAEQKAIVNNPPSEYVNIVISPIYGYDTARANEARKALEDKTDNKQSIKINEDMTSIFDDDAPFDMGQDEVTKQIAREAIEESVIELNKGSDEFKEELLKQQEPEIRIEDREEQLPEEEMFTSEITKDDIQEAFNRVERQSMVNDATSLFDLDDYVKDDSENDLFAELGGKN